MVQDVMALLSSKYHLYREPFEQYRTRIHANEHRKPQFGHYYLTSTINDTAIIKLGKSL